MSKKTKWYDVGRGVNKQYRDSKGILRLCLSCGKAGCIEHDEGKSGWCPAFIPKVQSSEGTP